MPKDDLLQFRIKPKKKRHEKNALSRLANFNVGFYLLIPILLGVFIGYRLDLWFGTKPFFVLVFIIMGLISSFYNLWKLIKAEKNNATTH